MGVLTTTGIGQHISTVFAERGCRKLFLVDLSEGGLAATKKIVQTIAPDADITLHRADIADETAVKATVAACVAAFGRIDFACNNAGVGTTSVRTADTTTEMYDKICRVNERCAFLCEAAESAQMLTQEPLPVYNNHRDVRGSIVHTCSLAGNTAIATLAAYSASKHGVAGMVRVDARELAAHKIRVNAVMPGFVDTPMYRDSGLTPEFMAAAAAQAPMNRMVDAREVAEAVVFLSGQQASAITGAFLPVDGGAFLYRCL